MRRHLTLPVLAAALACLALPALAQGIAVDAVNSIPNAFQNTVRQIEAPLTQIGLGLLSGLVVLEVCFALGMKWLDGAGLQEILSVVVKQGLLIGLFAWLVRFGPDMSRGVILWFVENGNTSSRAMGGSVNLSPGDVVTVGLNMVGRLWQDMSWSSPIRSIVLLVSGGVILYCFAQITAAVIDVTIRGYFFAAWAAMMMGFGGSAYTRDIALGQIRLAAAIGAERFVLTCIIGVGEGLMRTWGEQIRTMEASLVSVLPMIVCPIIMLRLVEKLPAQAHALITGHSHPVSYGNPVGSMMRGGTAAAIGAIGLGAAGAAAYSAAAAQIAGPSSSSGTPGSTGGAGAAGSGSAGASSAGGEGVTGGAGGAGANGGGTTGGSGSAGAAGGGSRLGNAARTSALAARKFGEAAVADVGKRLTGNYGANHGHLGFRMAQHINADAAATAKAAAKTSTRGA